MWAAGYADARSWEHPHGGRVWRSAPKAPAASSTSWWWHSPTAWPGGGSWWQRSWDEGDQTLKGHARRWTARSDSESGAREDSAAALLQEEGEPEGPLELPTRALTVQGSQQGRAMITGRKLIENRSWRIPSGWYALHVGARPFSALGDEWVQRLELAWPDAPPEGSLPSTRIVGLIHISEQRQPSQCGGGQSVWAVGPICHIIDEAMELPRPLAARGQPGLWKLSPGIQEQLARQLPHATRRRFPAVPRPAGSAWTGSAAHDGRAARASEFLKQRCWTQPSSYSETMDAACIAMSADGLVEIVNARGLHGAAYGVDQNAYRVQSKGVDALFGAISHLGTERQKGNDLQSALDGQMLCKQLMQVRLDLLPERVTDLFFLLAATNSRELAKFQHLGFRVVDSDIGANLAQKEDHRTQLTFEAVVIMCAIYKLGDGYWRIGSMNMSCTGSPRDLKTALMKLEGMGFPRKHEKASQEHMVIEGVRKYLELGRHSVKSADVHVDSSKSMAIRYAIEVASTEHEELSDSEAMARGKQLQERLERPELRAAILEEMHRFTNEKVKPERLRILPVSVKPLSDLRVEVRWEFGEVKRNDTKDHSYLARASQGAS
ncbi:unnamed protein product [Symbiodinium natans]|uniref:TerD domain-containing protein n=1 Tax=Symbiodinium natans TaxID=878477 RepID=A0A812NYD4_9DINO|nr:unnamed protein product [Symbiodinium natans]